MLNFKTLPPGTTLNTDKGPAIFLYYKENNLRGQTIKVQYQHSKKEHWYTEGQLREYNRREVNEV